MFAPIYRTLQPAVRHLVAERIYSSGSAPQGVISPYITWFVVSDTPYEQLSDAPTADRDSIQIDCWAGPEDDQELVCVSVARAVRDALDAAGQSNSVILNVRELDTKLFRIGLRVDFIYNR